MSPATIAVALALAGGSAPTDEETHASILEPEIVEVTRRRVYFRGGRWAGLEVGADLELFTHANAPPLRCRLDAVSDEAASCVLPEAPSVPPRSARVVSALRPSEVTARNDQTPQAGPTRVRTASVAHADLAQIPFPPVDLDRVSTAALGTLPPRLSARLRQSAWARTRRAADTFHVSSAELAFLSPSLALGLAADVALTAMLREARPRTTRFFPGDTARLWVTRAALRRTTTNTPLTASFGRFFPHPIPGLNVLDGAQLGWRLGSGIELGGFFGALPDPWTLVPALDRTTAGVYAAWTQRPFNPLVVRPRARAALVRVAETLHGELEADVDTDWGRWGRLALGGRLGAGRALESSVALDAWRVELTVAPIPALTVSGQFRALRAQLPTLELDGFAPQLPTRHASAQVRGRLFDGLALNVSGGRAETLEARPLQRTWFGPELELDRLFGRWGGARAGVQLERGWLEGGVAHLSAHLRAFPTLWAHALLDAVWAHADAPRLHELGAAFRVAWRWTDRLELSARTALRAPLEAGAPLAGVATFSAGGDFD